MTKQSFIEGVVMSSEVRKLNRRIRRVAIKGDNRIELHQIQDGCLCEYYVNGDGVRQVLDVYAFGKSGIPSVLDELKSNCFQVETLTNVDEKKYIISW